MSARTPEILLRPTGGEAEAHEHLVEDEHDAVLAAYGAQPPEPVRVALPVEVRSAAAVDEGRIGRRSGVGVHCLRGVHQHAGDIPARAQYMQRALRHIAQGVGLARRQRVADTRLHIAPPAVISAAKAHQVGAARVIAGKAHGLHHRFRAGHVERDLIEAGDLPEPFHVAMSCCT
jgi:hypothetical protein